MPRRPISEWPLAERPREKLLGDGSHALSDAELLAIILRLGTKGASPSILRGMQPNKTLHRTAISLRPIAAGELGRYTSNS
jgi:uncharacterized protein UPF0758